MTSFWRRFSIASWILDFGYAFGVMLLVGLIGLIFGLSASVLALAGVTTIFARRRFGKLGQKRSMFMESITILDTAGRPRGCLSSNGLQLLDEDGHQRIIMAVDADGPALQILDEAGNLQLNFGISAKDGSVGLKIADEAGKVRLHAILLETLEGLASFCVYDKKQRPRGILAMAGIGDIPDLHLNDGDGRIVWDAEIPEPTVKLA